MSLRFNTKLVQPSDDPILVKAAKVASMKLGTVDASDYGTLNTIVLSIANSGYARSEDGALDAYDISKAAATLFRNLQFVKGTKPVSLGVSFQPPSPDPAHSAQ